MGRSKQKEIGILKVENKPKGLTGLVKILSMKEGKAENRNVTFSATLEIEKGPKEYDHATLFLPLTIYPSGCMDLERAEMSFRKKTSDYLRRQGYEIR